MVSLIKAMGPSFGGKGILIEVSANLTVAGIAQPEGIACGFLTDFWGAAP